MESAVVHPGKRVPALLSGVARAHALDFKKDQTESIEANARGVEVEYAVRVPGEGGETGVCPSFRATGIGNLF